MKGCLFSAIGVISGFAVKAAAFFVNGILKTLASLLVFTGLYVPVFYLLYGGLLWWIAGFNPFDLSTDSMLYILGLCVCILCTLLIFVRNLIITPSHKIKEFFTARAYSWRGKSYKPEQPEVYRSRSNPDLIIYEYSTHYDVYRERYGAWTLLRRESKKGGRRRR